MKKLLNNKAIPFVEVFSKIISLINMLLLVKVLSIIDYANYSYIIATVLWASVLMDGGINSLVFNNSLKNNLKDINILYSARFIISSVIVIMLIIYFYYSKQELTISATIFSIIIYLSSTSSFIKMLARGKGYYKIDMLTILSEPILRLFLFLILYVFIGFSKWSLNTLLLVYLLAGLIAFIINYQSLLKVYKLRLFLGDFNKLYSNLKIALNASKFYLLYYFIYIGLSKVDVLFIEEYATKQMLSFFSAAIMLYGVMQLFFLSIITSQFKRIYAAEKKILLLILAVLLLVVLATNLLSNFVYHLFLSNDYENGDLVLNVVIWAIIPSVFNYYFTAKLNYEHKTYSNSIIMIIPLVFKIITYFIYKPSSIETYQSVYVFSEYLLLVFFLIYFAYQKIIAKK